MFAGTVTSKHHSLALEFLSKGGREPWIISCLCQGSLEAQMELLDF